MSGGLWRGRGRGQVASTCMHPLATAIARRRSPSSAPAGVHLGPAEGTASLASPGSDRHKTPPLTQQSGQAHRYLHFS